MNEKSVSKMADFLCSLVAVHSVFWSLSGAEVHQPSDSRSAEVLEPSFLQKNPAFRLRSMTGIFLCVVEAEHAPTDVICWFCVRFVESWRAATLRCIRSLWLSLFETIFAWLWIWKWMIVYAVGANDYSPLHIMTSVWILCDSVK